MTREEKIARLPEGTVLCEKCDGDGWTGWSWGTKDTCTVCRGQGWVNAHHTAPVIPLFPKKS